MQAVILAAGMGIRMRPLTLETPKPMLLVEGKPILEHIINSLPEEINEIILVVGYKNENIKKYFGDRFGEKKITYVTQEKASGTADALFLVRPLLKPEEPFLLMYADDLHDPQSIKQCLSYPRSLLVHEVDHPERFGIVLVDSNNKIIDIEEKPKHPKSNLAAVGVYVLDSHIFEYSPNAHETGEFYVTTMIQKMIKDYNLFAVESIGWLPIGYPEDLAKAKDFLKKQEEKKP